MTSKRGIVVLLAILIVQTLAQKVSETSTNKKTTVVIPDVPLPGPADKPSSATSAETGPRFTEPTAVTSAPAASGLKMDVQNGQRVLVLPPDFDISAAIKTLKMLQGQQTPTTTVAPPTTVPTPTADPFDPFGGGSFDLFGVDYNILGKSTHLPGAATLRIMSRPRRAPRSTVPAIQNRDHDRSPWRPPPPRPPTSLPPTGQAPSVGVPVHMGDNSAALSSMSGANSQQFESMLMNVFDKWFEKRFSQMAQVQPQPQPQPHLQPQPPPIPQPHLLPQPHPQPHLLPQPHAQPHLLPQPHSQPHLLPQPHAQPHLLPQPHSQPHLLPQPQSQPHLLPQPQSQPHLLPQPQSHPQPNLLPQPQPHPQPKVQPHQQRFSQMKLQPHQQPHLQPQNQPRHQPHLESHPEEVVAHIQAPVQKRTTTTTTTTSPLAEVTPPYPIEFGEEMTGPTEGVQLSTLPPQQPSHQSTNHKQRTVVNQAPPTKAANQRPRQIRIIKILRKHPQPSDMRKPGIPPPPPFLPPTLEEIQRMSNKPNLEQTLNTESQTPNHQQLTTLAASHSDETANPSKADSPAKGGGVVIKSSNNPTTHQEPKGHTLSVNHKSDGHTHAPNNQSDTATGSRLITSHPSNVTQTAMTVTEPPVTTQAVSTGPPVIDPDLLGDINEARVASGLGILTADMVDIHGNIKPRHRSKAQRRQRPQLTDPFLSHNPGHLGGHHGGLHGGFDIHNIHLVAHLSAGPMDPQQHRSLHIALRQRDQQQRHQQDLHHIFGSHQHGNMGGTGSTGHTALRQLLDPDTLADLIEARTVG